MICGGRALTLFFRERGLMGEIAIFLTKPDIFHKLSEL